jgi:hypothetical protein
MEENRNQMSDQTQQSIRSGSVDNTTDESGLHVQNPPKGAEQINESYSNGAPADQKGDASNYANTSGNEDDTGG